MAHWSRTLRAVRCCKGPGFEGPPASCMQQLPPSKPTPPACSSSHPLGTTLPQLPSIPSEPTTAGPGRARLTFPSLLHSPQPPNNRPALLAPRRSPLHPNLSSLGQAGYDQHPRRGHGLQQRPGFCQKGAVRAARAMLWCRCCVVWVAYGWPGRDCSLLCNKATVVHR